MSSLIPHCQTQHFMRFLMRMTASDKQREVIEYFKCGGASIPIHSERLGQALSQFIRSVYVYRDYTLEIEFNVSFEDFKTMAAECQEQGRNKDPLVYVTA